MLMKQPNNTQVTSITGFMQRWPFSIILSIRVRPQSQKGSYKASTSYDETKFKDDYECIGNNDTLIEDFA